MIKKAIFVGPLMDQTFTKGYDKETDTVIVEKPIRINYVGADNKPIYRIDSISGGIAYWFDQYEYPCISAIPEYRELEVI